MMIDSLTALLAIHLMAAAPPQDGNTNSLPVVKRVLDIGPAWSGHPVGFCLLTSGDRQYAAYFNDQRHMTVAARDLNENHWESVQLPSTLGWDSHNYITMTIDDAGDLHLCGNMHCVPLTYFRTDTLHDIHSFRQIPHMIGREEDRVTYPRFFRGPRHELIFTYRDGSSGKGSQIYNVYDPATKVWRRLLDKPLLDGEGRNSAYPDVIQRDRKGNFHLCWVWRSSPDCATNHDVCYARSRDLQHWEKSDGTPLAIPITSQTCEIVDPVPSALGLINGNVHLGFDNRDRPIISYHKYDERGDTQAYNARLENGRWKIRQVSNWHYRWEFSGGGSIHFEISVGPVRSDGDGQMTQTFRHPQAGSARWILSPETCVPIATLPAVQSVPVKWGQPESGTPGMQVHWAADVGDSKMSETYYLLRWETLPPNRDRPREGPSPPPSALRLLEVTRPQEVTSTRPNN